MSNWSKLRQVTSTQARSTQVHTLQVNGNRRVGLNRLYYAALIQVRLAKEVSLKLCVGLLGAASIRAVSISAGLCWVNLHCVDLLRFGLSACVWLGLAWVDLLCALRWIDWTCFGLTCRFALQSKQSKRTQQLPVTQFHSSGEIKTKHWWQPSS